MIVWITGASSGLGLHTAKALAEAGHTVIAGARSFTPGPGEDGIHRLRLDVTSDESAAAFVRDALAVAPRVDALVQCAGILMLGSCEETTVEEYRRILETDFLGMVRMNALALPRMRAQGSGRIIMFSSINGLLGIPFQSAYTAAKHAVEGYAECLGMEVHRHGIQVCLVEPGDHRSGSDAYRFHSAAMAGDSPYAADYADTTAVIAHDEHNGSDPDVLGRRVAALLKKRRMPGRLRVASLDQKLAVWLHDLLPTPLNSTILRSYYLNPKKAGKYREQAK